MALLTKEQIQDLYLQLDNVSSTSAMQKVIQEWNEKSQIKYDLCDFLEYYKHDWDDKFPKPKQLEFNAIFYDENGDEIERLCSFQERPVTPHPHAKMMAKYAEVSARRVDPWAEFQVYSDPFSYWVTLEAQTFFDSVQRYRYIGDDK
jgi:hypothetical protein